MLPAAPPLTRDEARAIGVAALSAGAVAVVTGLISWAFEEAKRSLAARRERVKPPPSSE